MKPLSAVLIYVLFWAVTFFAVLPFGVRTSAEAGEEFVPGQADSAPSRPGIGRKALWTTLISALLFGLFYANYVAGWITLDDLPGWRPRRQG